MLESSTHLTHDKSLLFCHELRTPLTSIQGALKLLGYQHLDTLSEDAKNLLTIAINNAERLNRLANTLEMQPSPPMTVLSPSKLEHLQLENDLHQAVAKEEFSLLYQPIVCLQTAQIIGFEALARWHHNTRGEISPEIFIPLAEKTDLIYDLGLFLLSEACRQLGRWQNNLSSQSPLSVSVNLSAAQLRNSGLVDQIKKILVENRIAPNNLKLEITESILIKNEHIALKILTELRCLGVQIYIDDFGTGYSSLGRLQELPFDTLKIDQSFVRNKNWIMSEAILMLAQRLSLDVIVEGVESLEDLINLQKLGCQKMQGYFFSRPIDAKGVASMLAQQLTEGKFSFPRKLTLE